MNRIIRMASHHPRHSQKTTFIYCSRLVELVFDKRGKKIEMHRRTFKRSYLKHHRIRNGRNNRSIVLFIREHDIPIWQFATAGHFEGGDFDIIEPGRVLIGYCGERSEKEGSEQVAEFVRAEGWEAVVAPISREFVHMDGLIVPLAEKLAVACIDAMEPWLVDIVKGWGIEIVDVSYREAKNLGVNLVALGDSKVLSMAGATDLNAKMRALGFEVYDPDMSMFTLGGGGVHCLSQALCREDA